MAIKPHNRVFSIRFSLRFPAPCTGDVSGRRSADGQGEHLQRQFTKELEKLPVS